jgi:hypothetical protein
MSRKSLIIGLIIGLVIGLPIGYFLPQILSNLPIRQSSSSNYAGYTEVKAYESGFGPNIQKFGDYNYFLYYYPNYIMNNVTYDGWIMIDREDVIGATNFPLTLNVAHNYYGITFVITELHPEYCIMMVKLNAS